MFHTAIAQFGFHVLLQSTLLIVVGLLAVRYFARHRPVVQSAILRATLIAVLLCPLASLILSEIGVTDYALFPAWESLAVPPSDDTTPTAMTEPTDLVDDKLTLPTWPSDINTEQTIEVRPYPEAVALTSSGVRIPSPPSTLADSVHKSVATSQTPSSGNDMGSVIPIVGSILSLVWLTGTILFLARLIVANISAARLRRTSQKADIATQELCRHTSQTLGLPAPEIKRSPRIHSPCLIGIRNPAILLPAGETFSPSVLRDVFLHELAHLARRDCLFHLLARLATALMFLQPLIWVLTRRLERIADDICDDYVVQYGQDRKGYAHTLVNFAEQFPVQWTTAEVGLGMVSPRSSLSRRVLRILDSTRSLSLRLKTGWVVTIALLGISLTTCAALLINSPSVSVAEDQERDLAEVQERDQEEIQEQVPESGDQVPLDGNDKELAEDALADRTAPPAQKLSGEAADPPNPDAPNPDATEAPTFHFRGKVLDPDGNVVEGTTIHYAHWNASDSPALGTVDERGEFQISIAPSNPFYEFLRVDGGSFVAIADGYGPAVKYAAECETTGEMQKALQQRHETAPVARSAIVQKL
jgi:beta-lactamase regulating signal transducer with metallopeptidase domain